MAALAVAFSAVPKMNPLLQNLLVKAAEYLFTTFKRPLLNVGTNVSNTAVQLRFKDLYVLETTAGLSYVDLFGDIALNSSRNNPKEARNPAVSWSFNSNLLWGIVFLFLILALVWGLWIIKRRIEKLSAEKEAMDIGLENLTTSLKGANDCLAKVSSEQEATGIHLRILATGVAGTEDKTAKMSTKQEATEILLQNLTTSLGSIDDKTAKLEDKAVSLSSRLAAAESAHKAQITEIKKGHELQIAGIEKNYGRKLARLKDQIILLSSEQAAVDSDHENRIAELNKIHGDKIAELGIDIAELEKNHGRQIAGLAKEIAELKKDRHRIAELSAQQKNTENRVAHALHKQITTAKECSIQVADISKLEEQSRKHNMDMKNRQEAWEKRFDETFHKQENDSREYDAKLQEHVQECDKKLDIASRQQEKRLQDREAGFKKFTAYHQEAQLSHLMNDKFESFNHKLNGMKQIERSHSDRFEEIDSQVLDLGQSVSADKKEVTERLCQIEGKSDGLAKEVYNFKVDAEEAMNTVSGSLDNTKLELMNLTETVRQLADCVGTNNPLPGIMQMFGALSDAVKTLSEETELIKEKTKGVFEFLNCLESA